MRTSDYKNPLFAPFTVLDSKRSKVFLIVFSGLFSAFFIFLFNPFNLESWNYHNAWGSGLPIFAGGLLGMPVFYITQFILREMFNLNTFKVWQFCLWSLLELTLLSLLFFFLFGTPESSEDGYWGEFITSLKYTFLILIIPYSMAILILRNVKKTPPISHQPKEPVPELPNLIDFPDENGKVIFTLKWDHLLFLKSEDNYINVHYLHNDEVEKKLIRTNLKKLSARINHPMLVRTHRSFMVNMENVVSMERGKRGFRLNLKKLTQVQIPVSATYQTQLETILSERNS
ncbi:MAG: LytTR family transcriptional regulator DNA-binding domain-containing protein [Bacteroidetes bacterium]|nr:LytTR family transcriptional regulator DNA-binding domain-containing protein [Bacteroidota bacterium]